KRLVLTSKRKKLPTEAAIAFLLLPIRPVRAKIDLSRSYSVGCRERVASKVRFGPVRSSNFPLASITYKK
ncbi:MAG: hypothetical protein ACRD1I_01805, partial [Terriglobia bacterium]